MNRAIWISFLVIGGAAGAYFYISHGKDVVRDVATGFTVSNKVEQAAKDAAHTSADVEGVHLALERTEGKIDTVRIDNPEGFSSEPAIKLGAVDFRLDKDSLAATKDPLIVRSLAVKDAEIRYEHTQAGSNLAALSKSIASVAASALADKAGASAADGRFIVDNVYVRNITIKIPGNVIDGPRDRETRIPMIHLSNIGRAEGGVSAEAATQVILAEILRRANDAGTEVASRR